jgi:hypothetical protein
MKIFLPREYVTSVDMAILFMSFYFLAPRDF